MRQFAVGPVDLGPRLEHGQDRVGLRFEQGVERGPAGFGVREASGAPSAIPPVRATLGQFQHPARGAHRPALLERVVDQAQQRRFRGRIDTRWDLAT